MAKSPYSAPEYIHHPSPNVIKTPSGPFQHNSVNKRLLAPTLGNTGLKLEKIVDFLSGSSNDDEGQVFKKQSE